MTTRTGQRACKEQRKARVAELKYRGLSDREAERELRAQYAAEDRSDLLPKSYNHRHLNDVLSGPTTAEHLAYHLYLRATGLWDQVVAVRVSETPKTWAEYRP